MGRSRSRASVLLGRLAELGLWKRDTVKSWRIAKQAPKTESFAMVAHDVLKDSFGFDFRTRAQVEQDFVSRGHEVAEKSADHAENEAPEGDTYFRDVGMDDENYAPIAEFLPTADVIDFAKATGNRRTPPPARDEQEAATDEQEAATDEHISIALIMNLYREQGCISRTKHPTSLPSQPETVRLGMFAGLSPSSGDGA